MLAGRFLRRRKFDLRHTIERSLEADSIMFEIVAYLRYVELSVGSSSVRALISLLCHQRSFSAMHPLPYMKIKYCIDIYKIIMKNYKRNTIIYKTITLFRN